MSKLTNFVVCHDTVSLAHFVDNNKAFENEFTYIMCGKHHDKTAIERNKDILVPNLYKFNIEEYNTLLTFTAWYFLAKNNIITTDYVGIFEYDFVFRESLNNIKPHLSEFNNYLIAFETRVVDDLFINKVKDCLQLFKSKSEIDTVKLKEVIKSIFIWFPTTNFIMPTKFLYKFVEIYELLLPELLSIPNHPHFHERAISIVAEYNKYTIKCFPTFGKHYQLNSHKISL